MSSRIIHYVHRYKRPPRRRKPITIKQAIVHIPKPKRLVGRIVRADQAQSPTPTRIVRIESHRSRWLRRMMER